MAVIEGQGDTYEVTFPNGTTMRFPAYALRVVSPKMDRVRCRKAAAHVRRRQRATEAAERRRQRGCRDCAIVNRQSTIDNGAKR